MDVFGRQAEKMEAERVNKNPKDPHAGQSHPKDMIFLKPVAENAPQNIFAFLLRSRAFSATPFADEKFPNMA